MTCLQLAVPLAPASCLEKKQKENNITSASEVIDLIEILKHTRMIEPRTLAVVRVTGTVSLRYASEGDSCAESGLSIWTSDPVLR